MRFYYLLLVPFLACIIIFKYNPLYGITLAFKDFKILKGIAGSPWAGFKYFEQLFNTASFWKVLKNTLILSGYGLVISFPMPILLALFINEIRNDRIKKTFKTITYLPHFISWVVAASLFKEIFGLIGPVNEVIAALGGDKIYFMTDTSSFRGLLVATNIWKGVGWGTIVYVAAIAGIDPNLYEAAEMDGAKKLQKIWHITIPCIRGTIITLFILRVGNLMESSFDQIYNLYSPAVYEVADVLDTFTYRKGLEDMQYSFATAAGLFQNGIGFILVIVSNWVVRKLSSGEEGLW